MKAADLRSLQRGLGRLLGVQLLKKVQSGFRVDSPYKNERKDQPQQGGDLDGKSDGHQEKKKPSEGFRKEVERVRAGESRQFLERFWGDSKRKQKGEMDGLEKSF